MRTERWILILLVLVLLLPLGCRRKKKTEQISLGRTLRVVATTTIVGNVVQEVGKDKIDLTILIPGEADPHDYELTPSDLRAISDADIIFINGLGLEPFIDDMVEQSGTSADVVSVSNGIRPRHFQEMSNYHRLAQDEIRGQFYSDTSGHQIEPDPVLPTVGDPHVWTNPHNVMVWTANIQEAMGKHDPDNAGAYGTNAQWFKTKLLDLDGRILRKVEEIPPLSRHLITDHLFLGYFADRYGFTQVGTIMPNANMASSPSVKQMARLEELIRRMKVPTIFTGSPIDESVAQQIANDLRIEVRRLYSGGLASEGSRATTYIDYMDYNLEQMIEGLKPRRVRTSDPTRPGAIQR